jgi:anti-sigma B factor antagonist
VLLTAAHDTDPDPVELLSVTTLPGPRAGQVVVEVTGEVDAYTAPVLDVCLQSQAARSGVRELVADLRRVTFLGAAGVTALARAQQRCRRRGVRMVIRSGGRRPLLRMVQLTGLADVVDVDPAGAEQQPTTDMRRPPVTPCPGARPSVGAGSRHRRPAARRPVRPVPSTAASSATPPTRERW